MALVLIYCATCTYWTFIVRRYRGYNGDAVLTVSDSMDLLKNEWLIRPSVKDEDKRINTKEDLYRSIVIKATVIVKNDWD